MNIFEIFLYELCNQYKYLDLCLKKVVKIRVKNKLREFKKRIYINVSLKNLEYFSFINVFSFLLWHIC